jgi:gamma-glutamylcyclotransferase (GGCT)/AIG2-like uncharacterized protein YtfP
MVKDMENKKKEEKEDIEVKGKEDITVTRMEGMEVDGMGGIEVDGREVLEIGKVDKVFVYGSLMEGFWNHTRVLEGKVEILGRGRVRGSLYHLREGYPALLEGEDDVVGEVVGPVDKDLLRQLDYLEGYVEGRKGNFYDRKAMCVTMSDGSSEVCWTYVYADNNYAERRGEYLPKGDWKAHMSGSQA